MTKIDNKILFQLNQCIDLLTSVLGKDLLGVYLYGSSVYGGLQKYSDIDLFVVSERATQEQEKKHLAQNLLQISGIYMKSQQLPIELTLVVKSEINPWHYPPNFDFQYGEWLRKEFENGIIEPWPSKVMPDLALLITQILLAHETLVGAKPNQLLSSVPYSDFILATKAALQSLMADLLNDTRNVLLTSARIWSTLATDTIRSKPVAALWVMNYLPEAYRPVLERARSICIGEVDEYWNDLEHLIQPSADFMFNQINHQILLIEDKKYLNKTIHLEGIS